VSGLELAEICQQSHVSVMGHNTESGNRALVGDIGSVRGNIVMTQATSQFSIMTVVHKMLMKVCSIQCQSDPQFMMSMYT